jgi:hypothetical protein
MVLKKKASSAKRDRRKTKRAQDHNGRNTKKTPPLPPALAAALRKQGREPEWFAGARLEYLATAEECARSCAALPRHDSGTVIPYLDWEQQPTGFYRFRYDEQPSGFAALTNRHWRYRQPKDTGANVYWTPGVPWSEVAKNAQVPLYLTEGEFKALAACYHTYPTIGLGGVWMFGDRNGGKRLLDDLKRVDWKGRPTFIVFDSDISTNHNVLAASLALASELTALGAEVSIVTLPTLGGAKTGWDDYLQVKGSAGFDGLVTRAEQFLPELHRMSEECVYVSKTDSVFRLADLLEMNTDKFVKSYYANRYMEVKKVSPATTNKPASVKVEKTAVAPAWLRWELRHELADLTYDPGAGHITEQRKLNTWPGWGCEPKAGDVEPFKELFGFLGKTLSSSRERDWLLYWFAYPIKHPGTKMATAVLGWSRTQGQGKSLLGYTVQRIYGTNFAEIKSNDLETQFNSWEGEKQFIMGDELKLGGHRKIREIYARLKNSITSPEIALNEKFARRRVLPARHNFYLNSNEPDSVFVADEDRRFFVVHFPEEVLPSKFYADYYAWLDNGGGAALFHYFQRMTIPDWFDPAGRAPATAAKLEMIEDTRSALELWVERLKTNPSMTLGSEATLWTAKQLRQAYEKDTEDKLKTDATLGRALGRYFSPWGRRGENTKPVSDLGTRVWIITTDEDERSRLLRLREPQIYELFLKQRNLTGVDKQPWKNY